MTSHGTSLGGWVEATAMTATREYANILAGRRLFGGDLTEGGKADVLMGVMARQQVREASGIGKAARMIRLMEANNLVDPSLTLQYEEASRAGDRHAVGRVLRDISLEYSNDPRYLSDVLGNEAYYNNFVSRQAVAAGPRAQLAQDVAAEDVKSIERGEMVERVTRDRARRGYQGALRLFRAAGLRPDLEAADRAGYVAMQAALEHGGGPLQNIGAEDRTAMAGQLRIWERHHMSTREMLEQMRQSDLFRRTPGASQLALVAAEGANRNLQEQLWGAESRDLISFQDQAREVFVTVGPRNAAAVMAKSRINKLFQAGNYQEAQEELNKFIGSSESGLRPDEQAALRRRLEGIAKSVERRIAVAPYGGAGALMEKGPLAGVSEWVTSTLGGPQAVGMIWESNRADVSGVSTAVGATSEPGGPMYRETTEAGVRARKVQDVGQVVADKVTAGVQTAIKKVTTKTTNDGSEEAIRVIIVDDKRAQPPPPIEGSKREGTRSGWRLLF
jgi:hypothetical protein